MLVVYGVWGRGDAGEGELGEGKGGWQIDSGWRWEAAVGYSVYIISHSWALRCLLRYFC